MVECNDGLGIHLGCLRYSAMVKLHMNEVKGYK